MNKLIVRRVVQHVAVGLCVYVFIYYIVRLFVAVVTRVGSKYTHAECAERIYRLDWTGTG